MAVVGLCVGDGLMCVGDGLMCVGDGLLVCWLGDRRVGVSGIGIMWRTLLVTLSDFIDFIEICKCEKVGKIFGGMKKSVYLCTVQSR
jgi:hypothetical protein